MNKQELFDAIAGKTEQTKVITSEQLDALLEIITKSLVKGTRCNLSDLVASARTGRNPRTGEEIKIAAAKTVKFTAGKPFREAANKVDKVK